MRLKLFTTIFSACPSPKVGAFIFLQENDALLIDSNGPEECSSKCRLNSTCVAWSLMIPTKHCYLHRSIGKYGKGKNLMWGFPCYEGKSNDKSTGKTYTKLSWQGKLT